MIGPKNSKDAGSFPGSSLSVSIKILDLNAVDRIFGKDIDYAKLHKKYGHATPRGRNFRATVRCSFVSSTAFAELFKIL